MLFPPTADSIFRVGHKSLGRTLGKVMMLLVQYFSQVLSMLILRFILCYRVIHTAVTGVLHPSECGTHTSLAVSCWWQMDGDCVCVCQETPCPRRCPSTKPVCECVFVAPPCLSMPDFCGEGSPSTLLGQSVSVRHPGLRTHHANTHTHTHQARRAQRSQTLPHAMPEPISNLSLSHTYTHLQSKDIGLTPISTTVCQCVEPTT